MGIFLYSLVLTRNEKLHVAKAQDLFGVRAFVCKNCYILGAQKLEDLKSFFRHGKLQKNTLCLLLAYHFFYYKSFYDTYPHLFILQQLCIMTIFWYQHNCVLYVLFLCSATFLEYLSEGMLCFCSSNGNEDTCTVCKHLMVMILDAKITKVAAQIYVLA